MSIWSLSIGLVTISAAFWLVERAAGVPRTPRRRQDTRLDLTYWFFTPLVTRAITRVCLGVAFALLAWSQGLRFDEIRTAVNARVTWASALPLWIQVPLLLFLADLLAYWTHRAFHGRRLWPFHAIHHSSPSVDWLSSVRLHPVNDAVARVAQVVPLYLLGFNGVVLAAFVPFLTLYALLLHANVNWTYGPLRHVLASPAFHRWHHTTEDEGRDTNFAGLFPFIDLMFGTFFMPGGRSPERFGVRGEAVPDGLWRQLLYPFRRTS